MNEVALVLCWIKTKSCGLCSCLKSEAGICVIGESMVRETLKEALWVTRHLLER